ncbi:MAG TPA: hypothetical protein VJQ55_13215 [Candidatus Binatia bacterium]|nr:hypothetical protein [Candidatus Binatia bacterium]
MKLRDHPLMAFEGKRNWPPVWVNSTDSSTITGEVGVLKHVVADVTNNKRCFLMIEHEGKGYVGTLKFNDVTFCFLVSKLFNRYIGRTIKEIGDLDTSSTL